MEKNCASSWSFTKIHNPKWAASVPCTYVYILQNGCRNKRCVFSQSLLPCVISEPHSHYCCRSRLTISPCRHLVVACVGG